MKEPLRLLVPSAKAGDRDPKALSCYGISRADTGGMLLRFVQGRPVRQVTEEFLARVCAQLTAEGKKALLLVWDNASWHVSKRVLAWIKTHNRQSKTAGGRSNPGVLRCRSSLRGSTRSSRSGYTESRPSSSRIAS